ncbi:MAG: hypothetical protein PHQ34_10600 [Methanothrix sp.]|nr:hypothetical protein [Methanothrix sp.]
MNVSLQPKSGSPPFYSNATLRADNNTTEGSKKMALHGVGPFGETERLEIDLEIVATRYFQLVESAAEITMKQNETVAIPVRIIRNPDYLQPITFEALGLPAGIVPAFDPSGSLPGAAQTTLLLKANPETRPGTYNLSIFGTGADRRTAYCNLSLKIDADRYFIILPNPPVVEVVIGNDSLSSIELTGVNNYTGKIKLRVAKYPKDIIGAEIDEPVVDLSAYSTSYRSNLKLHASADAIAGVSYYVVVNALGEDGYSANCSIMVAIEGQKESFRVHSQFGSLQLKPGESKNCEVTIEGIGGYEGIIDLSASDVPGITASIDPSVVHIDSKNGIASSKLSLYAQAGDKDVAESDMVISGSDARQNSDDCRIAISIKASPAATQPPANKTQVAESQSFSVPASIEREVSKQPEPAASEEPVIEPVIEPAISLVHPENAMPYIESIIPATDQIYSDQKVSFAAEASDPENDPIYYRFLHNSQIARDWSDKNTAEILMIEGSNEIEVQVIDGMHNGKDNYDDSKILKILANPRVEAPPAYENTSSEKFFDEISAREFNYNHIPIESVSAGTRERWYRNDPDSASYVGEYEIRRELFYSKRDYTIKLVLDNQSKPINVIFMQDSNIVSEMPSGFVEQAIRKLSSI